MYWHFTLRRILSAWPLQESPLFIDIVDYFDDTVEPTPKSSALHGY
jgi:hypothetical protein